jgi:hypothetical protein
MPYIPVLNYYVFKPSSALYPSPHLPHIPVLICRMYCLSSFPGPYNSSFSLWPYSFASNYSAVSLTATFQNIFPFFLSTSSLCRFLWANRKIPRERRNTIYSFSGSLFCSIFFNNLHNVRQIKVQFIDVKTAATLHFTSSILVVVVVVKLLLTEEIAPVF